MQKIICLSFDIEDWFQVENLRIKFPPEVWDNCESRVEENTKKKALRKRNRGIYTALKRKYKIRIKNVILEF